MARRRPRCACGDLFSQHDWAFEGGSPCGGPVCLTLGYRDRTADLCDAYTWEGDTYRPLAAVLAEYGLDLRSFAALRAEADAALHGHDARWRGPRGRAADSDREAP